MPFYQYVKERERVIRFLFIGEAKWGMKGVELDEESVAVFFIVEYGESIISVPEVHQRSFGDVEKFCFLVANKNVC